MQISHNIHSKWLFWKSSDRKIVVHFTGISTTTTRIFTFQIFLPFSVLLLLTKRRSILIMSNTISYHLIASIHVHCYNGFFFFFFFFTGSWQHNRQKRRNCEAIPRGGELLFEKKLYEEKQKSKSQKMCIKMIKKHHIDWQKKSS